LWQAVELGHPKLLQGLPNHVPFCPIWGNDATKSIDKAKMINNRLLKYVEFWKMGMCKDEIYVMKLHSYVAYWENILKFLSNPLPLQNSTLLEGFRLPAIGGLIMCKVPIPPIVDVDVENLVITPYCGPKNM
jgi:hypothetical protein